MPGTADANKVRFSYLAESSLGVPSVGNMKDLRYTGEGMEPAAKYEESKEIRYDRQVSDVILVGKQSGGSFNFELSYGAYDDLLEGMLFTSWQAPVTLAAQTDLTVSVPGGVNTITDASSGFATLSQYKWVKIAGFANAANNGIFKVLTKSNAVITLMGPPMTAEAAGASVTIVQGGYLENGVTNKSFSFEKQFTDLTTEYENSKGVMLDGMDLTIKAGAIIGGSMKVLGLNLVSATATLGTGYTLAPTNSVMNAVKHVFSILENGSAYRVTELGFSLTNNLRPKEEVQTLGLVDIGTGSIGLTGKHMAYYRSRTIMDKHLNDTPSNIASVVQDGSGNAYVFDVPQLKYTSGKRVAGGINTDVFADMQWRAYMHPSELVTFRIVRFPGP